MKKYIIIAGSFSLILGAAFLAPLVLPMGKALDEYHGVKVYDNGPDFVASHGRHYSWTGYYYGQKWQCVEFIKRFYFQGKGHRMPDVWGHAADLFDPSTPQGGFNGRRGLLQYRNGGSVPPKDDDLLVFGEMTSYGHVAIVVQVTENFVEVIQQNAGPTRVQIPMELKEGCYWVGKRYPASGWLRLKE